MRLVIPSTWGLTMALLALVSGSRLEAQVPLDLDEPARRALSFLDREVPRWARENHCFSCHNNGDAARALLGAPTRHLRRNGADLAETLDFLARPERWDKNGVDAAFSDKRLARVQFAAALRVADNSSRIVDRGALARAADLLVSDQALNGCWPIDEASAVGSPATYGPALATALAVEALRQADAPRFRGPISRAEAWFRSRPIENVGEAASFLIAMPERAPPDQAKIADAIEFLRRAQHQDGGWGPFLRAAPESFDTALALIALDRVSDRRRIRDSLRRGRKFLIASQNDDGSWPETTRPPGGESYAQRISTTAWATMALQAIDSWNLKSEGPPKS